MLRCFIFLIIFSIIVSYAFADTYKYIDKNGIVNFTNDIKDIPQEYKNKVEIIKEEKEFQKDIKPVKNLNQQPPNQETVINSKQRNLSIESIVNGEKNFWYELFISLFFAVFFIFAHRILFFIENKKIITLLRFAIVFIIGIYMFSKYANKQVETFLEAKKDINKIKKSLETKDQKIDDLANK
ncbi:MAG: hypothetical protein N2999_04320 [Proteobacteria bacterium]|nr:hypothetical protein [Pseudomonadota bacterium]